MKLYLLLFTMLWALVACDSHPVATSPSSPLPVGEDLERNADPAVIKAGGQLYQQHCAQCHGKEAEGDPAWRRPGADGRYPPPPLNGSGHAWHHSKAWLRSIIREGSQPQGNMPAWGQVLTDDEIEAVVAWFQWQWPDRVYDAWYEMQRRAI